MTRFAEFEQAQARGRAADAEARLRTTPAPERLDARIAGYLAKSKGGEFALARLRAETTLFDELSAQGNLCHERRFALSEEEERLRHSLYKITDHRAADVVEAELREVAAQASDLLARAAALGARSEPLGKRLELCKRRVLDAIVGGDPLRFVAPPSVDQKKVTLDGVRARIGQLQADAREIRAAPRTAAEVKTLVDRWIEDQMRRPSVARLFNPEDEITGPFLPGPGGIRPDHVGFLLWVCRGEIAKLLHAEVDRLADDRRALGEKIRAEKLAKCGDEILTAERQEEALAWQLMQDGAEVVLRRARPPRDFDGNATIVGDGVSVEAILSIA